MPLRSPFITFAQYTKSDSNMAKDKTVFVCTNCGQESPKWIGKCPSCGQWNTFSEEVVRKEAPVAKHAAHGIESVRSKPQYLREIVSSDEQRIDLMDDELNRVLGCKARSHCLAANLV